MMTQAQRETNTGWALDPVHSSVGFAAKHMVISTVKGRFGKLEADVDFDEGQPERSRVEARIDVASIDTGDKDRDKHLQSADFLDVERFPAIAFKSRRIEPRGDSRYDIAGDLTIHGVTREVTMRTEFAGTANDPWGNRRAGFSAETTISRKDFGLTWNAVLETGGFLVGDTVKISIEAELTRKKG